MRMQDVGGGGVGVEVAIAAELHEQVLLGVWGMHVCTGPPWDQQDDL